MYIFKYALKSVSRSIGRNILIGIIVLIIAVSSCVAMSIQRASKIASDESMKDLTVSAHIYVDRKYIMENFPQDEDTDMEEVMSELKGLDLEEMQKYAKASTVKDFYYSSTVSLDADLKAMNSQEEEEDSEEDSEKDSDKNKQTEQPQNGQPGMGPGGAQGGQGGPDAMLNQMVNQGEFVLEGYISEASMEDFAVGGSCKVTEGALFEENTSDFECIITEELATYNEVGVGDTFQFNNPNNEKEAYEMTIVGIYENSDVNSNVTASAANDPANTIITSYAVVDDIVAHSEEKNDEEDERVTGNVSGTYVFASVDDYDTFEKEVVEMGLEEKYTVASNDIATYEASLLPLNNLKSFATTFLYITLSIGAVVLIVLSIISIRDRKYEIGALAAIGLKKFKLSSMFMIETLTVVLVAIIIGSVIGAVISVPIANSLLSAQVEQQKSDDEEQKANFGQGAQADSKPRGGDVEGEVEYVSSIDFFVDYLIILKMILIGIGLSFVSGFVSIFFILRYDPKEILANRD